jgi:hypothetical protein
LTFHYSAIWFQKSLEQGFEKAGEWLEKLRAEMATATAHIFSSCHCERKQSNLVHDLRIFDWIASLRSQ